MEERELYDDRLGKEWIEYAEKVNPEGSREREIFPLIKNWLLLIKPASLLDIGCGQGICSTLVSKATKYTGIDSSSVLIERAKELYPSASLQFLKGSAEKLPCEDDSFDAEISIWVWSHIENLERAAGEMFRTLRSGGKFLIITANPDTYEERRTFYKTYKEKDGLLVGDFDLGGGKVLTNSTLYLHSRGRIEKAIKDSGLRIDAIDSIGQLDHYPKGLYLAISGSRV